MSVPSCLRCGMLACGHLHSQLRCAWRGAFAHAIHALQAAAAALPELAVAQAAEEWERELLVSVPSCRAVVRLPVGDCATQQCVQIGVGHKLMPLGACHDQHNISSASRVMLAELNKPSCHKICRELQLRCQSWWWRWLQRRMLL